MQCSVLTDCLDLCEIVEQEEMYLRNASKVYLSFVKIHI